MPSCIRWLHRLRDDRCENLNDITDNLPRNDSSSYVYRDVPIAFDDAGTRNRGSFLGYLASRYKNRISEFMTTSKGSFQVSAEFQDDPQRISDMLQ